MKRRKSFLPLLATVACGLVLICGMSMTAPPRVSSGVYGDVNGDGVVDIDDLNAVINVMVHKNTDAGIEARADINGSGMVDIEDLNVVINVMLGKDPGDNKPETQTFTVGGVSFKMIAVEGGTFTMGATDEQVSDAQNNEYPVHQVTLTSFAIGETEVTQELWLTVMGNNPSNFNGFGNKEGSGFDESNIDHGTNLQRPVEWVSWDACQEFIAKLNELTGENFRLPTEAEWEYAARGGNKSMGYKYAGSDEDDEVSWNSNNTATYPGFNNYGTHTVALKSPNELGLYDMSGNVGEWCLDYWDTHYIWGDQTDPIGPSTGSYRVFRGGGWKYTPKDCRVSSRNARMPSNHDHIIGLRLALGGAF